jgi:hypothetical protein
MGRHLFPVESGGLAAAEDVRNSIFGGSPLETVYLYKMFHVERFAIANIRRSWR